MKEARVRNWTELNEELFRDSWYEPHGRFRGPFVFRGMSNVDWDLQTSLMRLGGCYERVEESLLRNFQKYAHMNTNAGNSEGHWLASPSTTACRRGFLTGRSRLTSPLISRRKMCSNFLLTE